MRKLITLIVLLCGFMPVLWAADGCDQHLSREDGKINVYKAIYGHPCDTEYR